MTKKSMVQVVIGGKVLTMGGYDDETHIQRIASCVNRVMRQMEDADEYHCLPADLKPIFIHINIADELVTAQELIDQLEQELQEKEKEATSFVITPSYFTCAKSRTRFSRRFARRGVPRDHFASSAAPSGSISTSSFFADCTIMVCNSSGV